MTADRTPAQRLDELNEATIKVHARNIGDRGLSGPDSALHRAYRPGGGTLLEALRANAQAVYGGGADGGQPGGRRPRKRAGDA
jgi:hypothetical protein